MFSIRDISLADCDVISAAFTAQGWKKPAAKYEGYFADQQAGRRDTLVAFYRNDFAGYATIHYESGYVPFREKEIPEISDLNVLKKYQNRGLGAALIRACEERILRRSPVAGIGVGLLRDYGPAQRLYCGLGYVPDGRGITYQYRPLIYNDVVHVDDDLVLWMTRRLKD